MESKNIRFEKGGFYTIGYLMPLFTDKQIDNLFTKGIHMYSPIQSLTVQINIIEDEPDIDHKLCDHTYTFSKEYSCRVGDKCIVCGVIKS